MERLVPVNAPTAVPRAPPAHREKRRKDSGAPEREPGPGSETDDETNAEDTGGKHTIDEYV